MSIYSLTMDRKKFLKRVIVEIGTFQEKHFLTQVDFETKKHELDFVSFVDTESEKMFETALQLEFPNDQILGEESFDSKKTYDTTSLWVIDPLDGTIMFKRGFPFFGPMICYIQNNEIQLSALYNPITKELFYADETGAYCNGKKISVSTTPTLSQSVLVGKISSFPSKAREAVILHLYSAITQFTVIAQGKADGYLVSEGAQTKPWDILPGIFLVKQAGGKIKYDSLLSPGRICCGNPAIFDELMKLI